jgi:predicted transposase/invertase (TIGR01784 family)
MENLKMLIESPKKLALLAFFLSFSLYASDGELDERSSSSSRKRAATYPLESEGISKKQVFARTTFDSTSKHVLFDDKIRLDFIQTFTDLDIISTELLSPALNPLRNSTNLRELLTEKSIKNWMKRVHEKPEEYNVIEKDPGKNDSFEHTVGTRFIRQLSNCFGDLIAAFPEKDKDAQLDVVCRLSNKDLVLIEIQVRKEDCWDGRALAYAAGVYSNQLKRGEKFSELKRVVAINILGGGPNQIAYWKGQKPIRHYVFRDKLDQEHAHVIDMLQLIQYSLGDADLKSPEIQKNKRLCAWLEYFKEAHLKEEVPSDAHEALREAYQRVRFDQMSKELLERYEREAQNFENLEEYTTVVREKGKAEGKTEGKIEIALNMLSKGMAVDLIVELTGLNVEDIEKLKKD